MKRTTKIFGALAMGAIVVGSFVAGYALGNKETRKAPHKVRGIGGIFFKCKDPKALKAWYDNNLGITTDKYGTNFEWRQAGDSTKKGFTLWAPFKETTKYFEKEFMINYRVGNMDLLLAELKQKNILPIDTIQADTYGKFVHIMDPEGNRIELWEPNDEEYDKIGSGITVY
ncbi:VOC family protein [Polluticoccus soli]|uniref:VOC family protein n=1 Tax=Polluticoccus soli TaxID=3034150 RepID=UPI0023E2B018|nr:VOC family protein [Flavipsychrobacter sp. JY13-12]